MTVVGVRNQKMFTEWFVRMKIDRRLFVFVAALLFCLRGVSAAELNLSDTPLFISGSKTALVQLIMERDNKLFFEAYPSYEDINAVSYTHLTLPTILLV